MEISKRVQVRNALLELMELGVIDSKQLHTLIGYTAKKGFRDIKDILAIGIARHGVNVDLLPYQYGKSELLYKACSMEPKCIDRKMYERLLECGNIDKLIPVVADSYKDIDRLLKNGTIDRRFIKKLKAYINLYSTAGANV